MKNVSMYDEFGNQFTSVEEAEKYWREKHNISEEEHVQALKRREEQEAKITRGKEIYTQGVFIDEIPTQYGKLVKVSVKKEWFDTNKFTDYGYVHFIIKRSKAGKLYAENVKY